MKSARLCLALFLLAVSATAGQGGPTHLKAREIAAILAGNTATGRWNGTAYRQYFASDGGTVYVTDGGRPSRGKWRVDPKTNRYESRWERSGWTAYRVIRLRGAYAWVKANGTKHRFEVRTGRRLD